MRNNNRPLTQDILIDQINTKKHGEKLSHIKLNSMLEETAIHEAGHAIISKVLMSHIKIEQITVTPRGNTLGFVSYDYEDMQHNMTAQDFRDRICISFAGREAQIYKFGIDRGMDTGASNDLKQATKDAYHAIARFGMDKDIGYINISGIPNITEYATVITETNIYNADIEIAIKKWLTAGEKRTKELIFIHWDKINILAKLLLEKEVVLENELNMIFENFESIENVLQ